ncbi:MAG: FIVAR domain-containing protein, partial [Coriobacteriales bacterium]|nr:FIVAR domain-containing protein [Coriobacteriales bacterium]
MTITMMLPVSLASYAADPNDAEYPEVQQSQQLEQPEVSQAAEQELQPEEASTLVPLDDPDPADEPPAGEGTEASPYLIASVADLQWVRTKISTTATTNDYRGKYYKLTADIDMADVENWGPLNGNLFDTTFTGTFDGNGKAISNVKLIAATGNYGFFGMINGATIKDLALVNLELTNNGTNTGGIAGTAMGPSTISGCYVSGTITSYGVRAGGILGQTQATVTIENCRVDGAVEGSTNVGGILGRYEGTAAPVIRNCLVMASVKGSGTGGNIGGILGFKENTTGAVTMEDCRVLSKSISLQGGTTVGAFYGTATGSGVVNISDVITWKGLELGGILLKDILYGDPLYSTDKNGATILSWKLALQEGWPTGLTTGVWSYSAGGIPVLTKFAGKMSSNFPEYMSDYLTSPGTVNRAALTAAIQTAEALQPSQYPDAWDDFQLILTRAKLVLDDAESAQAELDTAVAALEDAVELLKSRNALELTGEGTEAEPYLIADVAQFQKMDRLINSADPSVRDAYRDKHYELTADIDMDGASWVPLGGTAVATAFTGVFDGNGKTISNLAVSGTMNVALFGYISGATIKDLTLEDYDIQGTSYYTAGIAAMAAANSTIKDCKLSGTISGPSYVGGIAAYVNGGITIKGCSIEGTVKGVVQGTLSGDEIGGIVAWAQGPEATPVVIEDCTVLADVTGGGTGVGGIVSNCALNTVMTIANCEVILSGTESTPAKSITAKSNAGGIVGNFSNNSTVKIENCSVTGGTIKATDHAGGIGALTPNTGIAKLTLTDCYVETDIETASSYAAGLLAQSYSANANAKVTITRCAFVGSVTGTTFVGGLIGQGNRIEVADCSVEGQIAGTINVGGMLGYKYPGGDVSIKNSYVLASVRGNEYVGGILGQQQTTDTGKFSVTGCRVLGETVARESRNTTVTLGALSGNAAYNTTYYAQADTFAWGGLVVDEKTLAATVATDFLFSPDRNGQGFMNWALKSAAGWPAALTDSAGAWTYSAGKLPVLKKFASKMSNDFPKYMADMPSSGELGDKTALQAAIATVEALNSTDYRLEITMWTEVQKQLGFARQVNDLYDASQAEIDAAKAVLTDAMAELNRLNNIKFTGEGTVDDPYRISNLNLLLKMNRVVNSPDAGVRDEYRTKHYELTADINMEGVSWTPLGGIANTTAFTGSFDGGGKTISNLKVRGESYLGFFGFVSGATIRNLTLEDFRPEGTGAYGTSHIGGIAAYSGPGTTITNCAVSGILSTNGSPMGGITGYLSGTISGCTVEVDINSTSGGNNIGGIVGNFVLGTIENCSVRNYSVNGAIESNATWNGYVGGIAGGVATGAAQNTAAITNCQVKSTVVGYTAGGIVGNVTNNGTTEDRVVISGCWFDGMVSYAFTTEDALLGGIAGVAANNFRITDCRSDGTITLAGSAAGILGRYVGSTNSNAYITNCYTTMRIGNGQVAGGLVGNIGSTYGTGQLVISDSLALNEQIGGATVAQAIHAIGEDNVKLDYTLAGVKAWSGMLIRVDGETQAAPSGANAVSYSDLQTAAAWPSAFQNAPWSYVAGKLPVLTNLSGMSGDFPPWMTNPAERQDIADAKALLALANSAAALVEATYTAESWEEMTAVLAAARLLLHNDRATQSAVDAATEALQAAIDGLEMYKVDTTLEGEGTEEAPFLIGSVEDYEEMSRLLGVSAFYRQAYYKLTNDIDLLGVERGPLNYTSANTFDLNAAFGGDFDGGGFTISNLVVKRQFGTGMFGYAWGARIHDLNLENCVVSGTANHTGALVGNAWNTVFENINVTGRVTGASYTGGIAGAATQDSTMKNCHFEGIVDTHSTDSYYSRIGGLCGQFDGNIEGCSFKGELTYKSYASASTGDMGGIAGSFSGGDIRGCQVEAVITYNYDGGSLTNAGSGIGGIAGIFSGENIIDCHFKGKLNAYAQNVGGIAGGFTGASIRDCTSEGEINMNDPRSTEGTSRPAGGIVGWVNTDNKGSVVIDNVTTTMGIDGMREAGGIGGVVIGGGTLTISNAYALNKYLNNATGDLSVNPFFFGEDWYTAFTGSLILKDNYIWEGMMING